MCSAIWSERQKSWLASGGEISRWQRVTSRTSKPCAVQHQHHLSHNISVRSVRGINNSRLDMLPDCANFSAITALCMSQMQSAYRCMIKMTHIQPVCEAIKCVDYKTLPVCNKRPILHRICSNSSQYACRCDRGECNTSACVLLEV